MLIFQIFLMLRGFYSSQFVTIRWVCKAKIVIGNITICKQ